MRPQRSWRNTSLSKNGNGVMVVLSALRQILATHQQRAPVTAIELPNKGNLAKCQSF
jgi:hypothetical protein